MLANRCTKKKSKRIIFDKCCVGLTLRCVRKALTRGQREQWLPIAVILGMGMCPAWSIFLVGDSILPPSEWLIW